MADSAADDNASPSRAHRRALEKHVDISPVDHSKRLNWYYGVARQISQQADKFLEEGDLDRAYIFYRRFCHLAVERIPNHNSYKDKRYAPDKSWLAEERRRALPLIESIVDRMDQEIRLEQLQQRMLAIQGSFSGGLPSSSSSLSPPPPPSPPPEPSAPPLYDLPTAPDGPLPICPPTSEADNPPPPPPPSDAYSITDVPPAEGVGAPSAPLSDFEAVFARLKMEDDGPKAGTRYYPEVMGLLGKPEVKATEAPPPPAMASSPVTLPRGVSKMRTLVLATGLVGKFAQLALPNTNKGSSGIETCGVLAGVQEGETLRLTTLIIPKQTGTSDTVSMTHEEELFEYCHGDGRDLIVLGWIHTHPRQSCFMSSVDVHTHCGFQTMLPEAVAIVVAPTDRRKQVGVFRLTEPQGLQLIQKCTLRGFHTHQASFEIYQDHHRIEWQNCPFRVVDLR